MDKNCMRSDKELIGAMLKGKKLTVGELQRIPPDLILQFEKNSH